MKARLIPKKFSEIGRYEKREEGEKMGREFRRKVSQYFQI